MTAQKEIILSSVAHYLPGSKSGGPLVSVRNICDGLCSEFDFKLLTADRDLGDTASYPDVSTATWYGVGNAQVNYLSPSERDFRAICRAISQTEHDLLYLNSFFASWATIFPLLGRQLGLVPRKPLLLAPRGEFSKGALALKANKKKAYLLAAKHLGLLRDVQWHASTEFEAEDIARTIGTDAQIFIASDLPDQPPAVLPDGPRDGDPVLHIVFLSRISPKKNLEYAIDTLTHARVRVQFNIYGPAEDLDYWTRCQAKLKAMPRNVTWTYHGAVPPDEVPNIMRSNDLFFLPTHGENFGHVIAEALSMGTRVLLSDQTPWRELTSRGLGNDISLSKHEKFLEVIKELAYQAPEERLICRKTIHSKYLEFLHKNDDINMNLEMFRRAVSIFRGQERDK